MGSQIPANGCETLAQLFSISPVPAVPETAEPLRTVGLAHRCPGPDHLPAFASPLARGTHLIQPAKRWGKVISLRKRALPGRFSRAIDVKHHPGATCSIHQTSHLFVRGEWTSEQIIEKEPAESVHRRLRQRR